MRRPEHRLLLCCARTRLGEETAARVRDLARGPVDWDYLYRLARRHSLLPLLYRQLSAAAVEVPAAELQRLKDSYRENVARNLYLTGELLRIVALFEAEGVAVIPYKGPALAACAYGDAALRRYVDLDVLVRKPDVARAKQLLVRRGFRPAAGLNEAQEKVLLRSQHNLAFTREDGLLIVELHWELVARRYARAARDESFWSRLVPLKLGGREVRSLAPEDLLLSLCVHGTKHLWERLAWVCDVAELTNSHPELDWPNVLREAEETRTVRMLLLGLYLARQLLDAGLPREVEEKLSADPALPRLAAVVTARLFDGAEHRPAGLLENVRFNLLARRGVLDKVRYFRFIFTPTDGDLSVLALPPKLSFGYYLLRPFRLLLKGDPGH